MTSWDNPNFEKKKQEIKAELDAITDEKGFKARLCHIRDNIHRLDNDLSSNSQMERFIYVVSALIHQLKFGGLKAPEVSQLVTLGLGILKIQGIEISNSRLSHLYGELYSAKSQISFRNGEPLKSIFEQQLARYSSGRNQLGSEAYRIYSMAIRLLGLGLAVQALAHFEAAEALAQGDGADSGVALNARLSQIKCLRLMAKPQEARDRLDNTRENWRKVRNDTIEVLTQELAWEEYCLAAQVEGDLNPMLKAIKSSHKRGVYILEAHLWVRAISDTFASKKLKPLEYYSRKKLIDLKSSGYCYKVLQAFEICYATNLPMSQRMHQLANVLLKVKRLAAIDKELLTWAAATRFFSRNKYLPLATVSYSEYQMTSGKLSGGESADIMGLFKNQTSLRWFSEKSIFS
jgi:hypothetical protein